MDDGFALFVALRAFVDVNQDLTAAVAEAAGLHTTDASAVLEVAGAAAAGAPLSAVDLRRRLRLSPPATTALLDRLERSGHVTRHRDPDDRRRVLLSLTAHGDAVVRHMLPALATALAEVAGRHDARDRAAVVAYVDDLVAAIGDVTARVRASATGPHRPA